MPSLLRSGRPQRRSLSNPGIQGAHIRLPRISNRRDAPISIYEVHLGSWRRKADENNRWLTYRELAAELPGLRRWPRLYPCGVSADYGAPLRRLVGLSADRALCADKPVSARRRILRRWLMRAMTPALALFWIGCRDIFPTIPHGLANFDGTALFEHADPKQGRHLDWNTLIYNFGRREVTNFLISNGLFWLERYGVDGLRVDAVASMLYLDYSRPSGGWVPNRHGGRENLDAIEFLRRANIQIFGRHPRSTTTSPRSSTAWPMVSRPWKPAV